jgi:flagellar protein FlaG
MQVETRGPGALLEKFVAQARGADMGTRQTRKDTPDSAVKEQASGAISQKAIEEAVETANRLIQQHAKELRFDVDAESGKTIVRVVDLETRAVLMQIPSEEMLALSKALEESQASLLHSKVC